MDFKELKNKSREELRDFLARQREDLRVLRFKAFGGHLKQSKSIAAARKTVARINTALRAK